MNCIYVLKFLRIFLVTGQKSHPSFIFCAIVLYLVVYHVCFQDGKLCLLDANDKLESK
jgi:hypothetical protein